MEDEGKLQPSKPACCAWWKNTPHRPDHGSICLFAGNCLKLIIANKLIGFIQIYISVHKFQMALWGFQTEIASSKKGIIDQHFSPCYIKPDDLILLGSLFLVFMRIEDEGKISRPKDCQRHNPTLQESTAISSNKLFLPNISATLSIFDKRCQQLSPDFDSFASQTRQTWNLSRPSPPPVVENFPGVIIFSENHAWNHVLPD